MAIAYKDMTPEQKKLANQRSMAYAKRRYKEDPEFRKYVAEQHKKQRLKKPEEYRQRNLEWQRKNKKLLGFRAAQKRKIPENWKKAIINNIRARAKRKGVTFSISEDDIETPEYCPALGVKLEYGGKSSSLNRASVDRIVPGLGYVKGNVVVISVKANIIKCNATAQEIAAVARWVDALQTSTGIERVSDHAIENIVREARAEAPL